jgi:DNA polymerase-3 subunit beta
VKLTIEPGALAAAVKFAARELPARAAHPILGGLKITASADGTLEVSAFDYETSACARIGADVGEPGTVLALGRLLAEITARLPRQSAELATDEHALTVACGSTRYRLHLLPLAEYPALPELPPAAGYANAGEFAAAVAQVTVAASHDDTLPVLTAVQVTFGADAMTMVATDRYRAAFARLPWQATANGPLPAPVLVPATAISAAACAADSGPVSIHVVTAPDGVPVLAGFGSGGQVLTTLLLSGEYPSMAAKIPGEFAATAVIATAELADAVRRLAIVAPRDMPVTLAFTPGQVELTAGSDSDADGREVIGCDLDGAPVTIGFHPRRLLDAVTAAGAPRARIAVTTPTRAALITPADGEDDSGGRDQNEAGPAYRHVLMPIRLPG